ncbi:LuxR C-terminal-related transcriptional regulator [Actinoplanes sp. NPDC051411]|uniref:LuxR C-terminal-related transcriptional regulator n=1 Tax=Actinoplanes sp. NPDC051411 TaxID=3155522 RepID=UPI00342D7F7F
MTIVEDSPAPGRPRVDRLVSRPRLLARLDSAGTALTVVSAAAGWGKSTLLASWARHRRGQVVPVAAGSAAGIWARVSAAVSSALPVDAQPVDRPPDGPDGLAATLERLRSPIAIVLDDCNDAAPPDALAVLAHMTGSGGALTRLVLACRGTPALDLHRWRMDGQLLELTEDDLAFSVDEAAELLGDIPAMSRAGVADLRALAEGWPTGLGLTAVALRRQVDPAPAVPAAEAAEFVGDYLRAEVLATLDPPRRDLLAAMSVAERLTAGLVNALTGRADGEALLVELHRQGIFLRGCPGPGDWYRLHPMLARVLYQELSRDDDRLLRAHRRAAGWYLMHGPPVEALRHLLAARQWATAVEVLDRHWADITAGRRRLGVRPIITPPDLPPHPRLALALAAERLDAGDTTAARQLVSLAGDDTVATAVRLTAARVEGSHGGVGATANAAAGEPLLRPHALLCLGADELQHGRLTEAQRHLGEAWTLARQHGLDHVAISAAGQIAVRHATMGRLYDAVRVGTGSLEQGCRIGLAESVDLSWSRLALAEAYLQWDRFDEAWRCVEAAQAGSGGDRAVRLAAAVLETRVRVATGRLAQAYETLRAAQHESAAGDVPAPTRRALGLADAELRLACGDTAAAHKRLASWAGDDPWPGEAAVVEGQVLLALGRPAAAGRVVAPYLADGPDTSLTCRCAAGVTVALAAEAVGDRPAVVRGLEVALTVADEQDHRRAFTAAGHRLRSLLEAVAPTMASYAPVVAALAAPPEAPAGPGLARPPGPAVDGPTVEPLTSREMTVLRYLQGTLSHVEIAALLYISVNTVKTHVKNIYRKLGAARRTQAVRVARDLRLL